ncbi:universal stress protein [Hydrogenophaga sp.]|uniref:universal stress protein n=1 Tax=Hydrogenophaga sp. TaxID=1904254 RepID=UPI003F70C563
MNSLRSIVTATDLSAPSRHATSRAAMLAKASGASMTLMHAVDSAAFDDLRRWLGVGDETSGKVEQDARRQLQEVATEVSKRHGIDIRTHLTVGHPVDQITRHGDELDADLLVTGTRGAGFFRGVLVGSTAERVAKRSSRPVLLVRQLPRAPYRRILVPVDFSEWSRASIDLARQLAPRATLVLMHALEMPYEGKLRFAGVADDVVMRYRNEARREAQQRLRELATEAGLRMNQIQMITPDGADPWMLIVQQEQEHDCDLVVIGRQGRHALDELLLGSTTRMVISEGASDTLVSSPHPGRAHRSGMAGR